MADDTLVITGPTASGKTALAIAMAERIDGEVISADSRQVYRGMDIGTAKATATDRARVPHHGLDLVDPDARYSAGRFARDARRWIAGTRERGRVPILAGGTGFFIRALTHPLFREPELDPARRERLRGFLEGVPPARLADWLGALDPAGAEELAARGGGGGRQRVLRLLEVSILTGRPLAWWHENQPPAHPPLSVVAFVLDVPLPTLYDRIDSRVDEMFRAGLADEVRRLEAAGYHAGAPGMSATGYPETLAWLHGEIGLEEAKDRIRRATRRYARRQLTWFRHQLPPGARWIDADRPTEQIAEEVMGIWRRKD